jgi:hypothetical protein
MKVYREHYPIFPSLFDRICLMRHSLYRKRKGMGFLCDVLVVDLTESSWEAAVLGAATGL